MKVKGAETKRWEIKEELIGGTGKRAFTVEGESDKDAFGDKKSGINFLTRRIFLKDSGNGWIRSSKCPHLIGSRAGWTGKSFSRPMYAKF